MQNDRDNLDKMLKNGDIHQLKMNSNLRRKIKLVNKRRLSKMLAD